MVTYPRKVMSFGATAKLVIFWKEFASQAED
jgi:hypothetical protein